MDAAGVRRVCSPDEIACCVRQSRVVLAPRPWRQVGRRHPAGDGGKKRRFTGESTKELVQTIARGKPERLAEPVVTTLVCFLCLHARLRVLTASGFPCALCFREG